jgi:hypothetical protein
MNNMYFIVGCGRSGTNWLAQIIDQHPDVFATIEHPDIFPIVTECALDPHNKKEKLKPVFDLYRKHASEHKIYLDKSHPNLWHIDLIREEFPEAKFVGIQRDVYGVVSSMLNHEGCLTWVKNWKDYPLPNKFLGVTEETKDIYGKLDLMEKCVWRWCSHDAEMRKNLWWRDSMYIEYDVLVLSNEYIIDTLSRFMDIDIKAGRPDEKCLTKCFDKLNSKEALAIVKACDSYYKGG